MNVYFIIIFDFECCKKEMDFYMKKILKFILTFLVIGLESLGNQSTVTLVLEDNLVRKNNYVKEEDLIDALTLARLGPGATTSNMVAFLGNRIAGFWGGVLATICYVIAPLIVILIFSSVVDKISQYDFILSALRGGLVVICIMIVKSIFDIWKSVIENRVNFVIFVVSLVMVILLDFPVVFTIIGAGVVGVWSGGWKDITKKRKIF